MSDQDPAVPSPSAGPATPPPPPPVPPYTPPGYGAPTPPGYSAPTPPGYSAPTAPGYGAPTPPGDGAPTAPGYGAPGYGAPAFAAPYTAPSAGSYRPEPAPAGPPLLGIVALIASGVALVLCTVIAAIAAADIGAGVAARLSAGVDENSFDWSLFTPVRGAVLLLEITFWAGTALGLWGIVQGIVATVKKRGRGYGIAAISIGVIAPVVFGITVYIVFLVALAGQAAQLGLMT